jgi:hypothetical protein
MDTDPDTALQLSRTVLDCGSLRRARTLVQYSGIICSGSGSHKLLVGSWVRTFPEIPGSPLFYKRAANVAVEQPDSFLSGLKTLRKLAKFKVILVIFLELREH